ncbi:MAG: hypothetical protein ABWY82_26310 [Tardiphaga sp.]
MDYHAAPSGHFKPRASIAKAMRFAIKSDPSGEAAFWQMIRKYASMLMSDCGIGERRVQH